eukprot:2771964-Pyramimonas_sp.AAC.1
MQWSRLFTALTGKKGKLLAEAKPVFNTFLRGQDDDGQGETADAHKGQDGGKGSSEDPLPK